jgi:hypothetical protein
MIVIETLRSAIRARVEVRIAIQGTYIYVQPLAIEPAATGWMLRYSERGQRRELRMPLELVESAVRVDELGRVVGRPRGRVYP